ncbi:MAG: glycosyltransferase [Candidatus Harrisonbacteria bacterium]|nr:glycosyltransferase [Candidatus Harrisonbacteria bacterium]
MKIVVIIPTYNERETISNLIDALEEEFKNIPNHEMGILIVDGNSPDGTAEAVNQKKGIYKNIDLIVEKEKRGLGMAYITGINYAVKDLKAGAFIEFDGDFQHDPKDIKRLIAELDNGYDYVIGSRYVLGGSIPQEWAWHRKLLSRFGSLFIKWVLRLPTNDNTSGLKLSRAEGFFEKLPLDENRILSRRHAYKIHLLYEMYRNDAKIKEIQIKFLERGGGASKSSLEDIFESLRVAFALRFRK